MYLLDRSPVFTSSIEEEDTEESRGIVPLFVWAKSTRLESLQRL